MSYTFTFATVGGNTRVRIQNGEDIRHLGELDKKMWTVLSCPTKGLEISDESLSMMNTDGDESLHVNEVIDTANYLNRNLHDLDTLFAMSDELKISNIKDEAMAATAAKIGKETITLKQVDDTIAAIDVPQQPLPDAPYEAEVIAAYQACKDAYTQYYEQERLQKMGLYTIPEDTPKPGMSQEEYTKMGEAIAAWEATSAEITTANAAAIDAAKAEYIPLRKLVILHQDFVKLLRNFVTLEDFYEREKGTWAIFQAGTLIIDQRACNLCMKVSDMSAHSTQAGQSGMFLIYCDCKQKKSNRTMQIVAALTVGDIKNVTVGKNAIFYDRQGEDWDATVVKVIDNPISIGQAFWSPYRKMAQWITDMINKSAAEKDKKAFDDMTADIDTKVTKMAVKEQAKEAEKKSAFDIAKFAGIFAAIGMAIGFIGSALADLAKGINAMPIWQLFIWIVGLILVISGPAMIMAAIKLRKRNLAPLLNANGWAVNADAIVSVIFGATLTEQAQFPLLQIKKKMSKASIWAIVIGSLLVLAVIALLVVVFFAPEYGERAIELFRK